MQHLFRFVFIMKDNFIFLVSATGALALHMVVAWQPLNCLEGYSLLYNNAPLIDESYIFFKMSRDLGDWFYGWPSSFQLTSGFQPLIALLYLPFFYLFWFQKEFPIHLALSLNAFLGFFASIFLYLLLRKIVNRAVATFLASVWIWSPYVLNQTINGMETTLAMLLLLMTLNYYWRINHLSPANSFSWILLGLFLGIGFWARIELGMLGVAIILDQAWLATGDNRHSLHLRLRNILLCSLTFLAVASPWIVLTIIDKRNLLPVSIKAVNQITRLGVNYIYPDYPSLGFIIMMLKYFIQEFHLYQPLAALSEHTVWQLFITGLCLAGFIIAVRDRNLRVLFRPVWFFQIIMLAAYITFIGGWWHLNRYLYPAYTLMLLLHAATLHYLVSKIKLRPWILGMILFFLFIPYALSYTFQYYSHWSKNRPARYFSAALFAKDHIPPKVKVGAFQSGCFSYWLDNKVVNLDGVINEKAYFHLKDKTLGNYLDEQQIDYIVEEVFTFNGWNNYLGGQLSKRFKRVALKEHKQFPRFWKEVGVYKRKQEKAGGVSQREYVSWYANGQKATEGKYKNGKKHGIHFAWRENGQIKSKNEFLDGKKISMGQ